MSMVLRNRWNYALFRNHERSQYLQVGKLYTTKMSLRMSFCQANIFRFNELKLQYRRAYCHWPTINYKCYNSNGRVNISFYLNKKLFKDKSSFLKFFLLGTFYFAFVAQINNILFLVCPCPTTCPIPAVRMNNLLQNDKYVKWMNCEAYVG